MIGLLGGPRQGSNRAVLESSTVKVAETPFALQGN